MAGPLIASAYNRLCNVLITGPSATQNSIFLLHWWP